MKTFLVSNVNNNYRNSHDTDNTILYFYRYMYPQPYTVDISPIPILLTVLLSTTPLYYRYIRPIPILLSISTTALYIYCNISTIYTVI